MNADVLARLGLSAGDGGSDYEDVRAQARSIFSVGEVEAGPEFERILARKTRDIPDASSDEAAELAEFLTRKLAKVPEPDPGDLTPLQALALKEAWEARGLFGMLPVGIGKAQPIDEPVLTPSGWVEIGQLKAGDEVIGSDGKPQHIVGVHPQGVRDVAKVTFSDRSSVRCDWDHLWTFRLNSGPKSKVYTRTLREWKKEPLDRKCGDHRAKRLFAPMLSAPASLSPSDAPLDPYLLGLLLGDGSMSVCSVYFTTMDEELRQAVEDRLPAGLKTVEHTGSSSGKAKGYYLTKGHKAGNPGVGGGLPNPLKEALKKLGLFGHTAHGKFVPECYSSFEQRWAVLQGLMDTDGHAGKAGAVDYVTASEALRDWAAETFEMAGGTAVRTVKAVLYKGEMRTYYRLHALTPSTLCPFRLSRKAEAYSAPRQRSPFRAVTAIEDDGRAECVCISVSNADALYVTRHCVLTHNSLISYLLPTVLGAKRPLYMCPGSIRDDAAMVFSEYAKSWRGPSTLPILTYNALSAMTGAALVDQSGKVVRKNLLARMAPDLIIMDEGHKAKDSATATSRRILAYLEEAPETMVCVLTGTPFTSSIKDAAHLIEWALGWEMCPFPTDFEERETWASFLDAKKQIARVKIGALEALLPSNVTYLGGEEGRSQVRDAVAEILLRTPGVVGSQAPPCDIPLHINEWGPKRIDPAISEAFDLINESWTLPDGTALADPMQVAEARRRLGLGFWNRFEPPPPKAWREARSAWAKWCRDAITPTVDTEGRVKAMVMAGHPHFDDGGLLKAWLTERDAERARTGHREPPSVAVFVSDEAIESIAEWVQTHGGLVWTASIGLGERLEKDLGIPYYRGKGLDSRGRSVLDHPANTPAIVSFLANGTGKNLQFQWSKSLWLTAPGEQELARTHRLGQSANIVENWTYLGCMDHLKAFYAQKDVKSRFAGELQRIGQKLQTAHIVLPKARELAERDGSRWEIAKPQTKQ